MYSSLARSGLDVYW